MARTRAPLLSFGGSGQIGKTMVMSSWRGIKYAREYVVPSNPRTIAQQTVRTTFALLREMWKLAPAGLIEPWNAFAEGRPFTGMNKFVGENIRVLNGETDMALFIGSPGAKGGLPPVSVTPSVAGGAGHLDITVVPPAPPLGWTLTGAMAVAFPDQDPSGIFAGTIAYAEDLTAAYVIAFTGLAAGDTVSATWLKWTKPDGKFAYSVGITDISTVT